MTEEQTAEVVEEQVQEQLDLPLSDAERVERALKAAEGDAQEDVEAPESPEEEKKDAEPVEEEEEPEKSPGVAESLAKIARAEARSRERIKELESQVVERAEAIKAREVELERYFKVFKEFDTDPEMAIGAIESVMGKKTPEQPQEDPRIAELQQKLAQMEAHTQQQAIQSQVTEYRGKINTQLASDDSFNLLKAEAKASGLDPTDFVAHYVAGHHSQQGELLDPEQACILLEQTLAKRVESLVEAGLVSKKEPSQVSATSDTPSAVQSATLTNRAASQVVSVSDRDQSEEARLRRATMLAEKLGF